MADSSETATRIVLVRHGHVEGIAPERFRGRRDVGLSDLGLQQARATAQRIAADWLPQVTYASPLRRCVATAEAICDACSVPLVTLPELNDVDYGDWEWCTHEQVRDRWPELYQRWRAAPQLLRFPNGESLTELLERTSDVLHLVRERHRHQTVVIVGHSANNRILLLRALDEPLSNFWRVGQDPCAISEIELLEHGSMVAVLNETRHLEAVTATSTDAASAP
jgi:broad specificity phosphatase PhoE